MTVLFTAVCLRTILTAFDSIRYTRTSAVSSCD